jgi:non-homologous end joining protein Ku
MAASVWTGYLTFGLISMPVRLFSGARSSGVSFNMLHRDDLSRLKQQYVCLAACTGAPMMMVDHVFHENLTHESIDKILDELT